MTLSPRKHMRSKLKPVEGAIDVGITTLPNKSKVCRKCDKVGHFASMCKTKVKEPKEESINGAYAVTTGRRINLDSGTVDHVIKDKELLSNIKPTNSKVKGVSSKIMNADGEGEFIEGHALLVHKASENLASVGKICDEEKMTLFFAEGAVVADRDDEVITQLKDSAKLTATREKDSPYYFDYICDAMKADVIVLGRSVTEWHQTLGCAQGNKLRSVFKALGVSCKGVPSVISCKICAEMNLKNKKVNKIKRRNVDDLKVGERINIDLMGPFPKSLSGYTTAVICVDSKTQKPFSNFCKSRAGLTSTVEDWIDDTFFFGFDVGSIHGDNELDSKKFQDMCKRRKIKLDFTCPNITD
eukprot:Awhi_evm3s5900